jgi:hypothetical protein
MNHFVQRPDTTPSDGAASSPCFSPYFGQNGQRTDRMAAVKVEPPFERPVYLQAERQLMAEAV